MNFTHASMPLNKHMAMAAARGQCLQSSQWGSVPAEIRYEVLVEETTWENVDVGVVTLGMKLPHYLIGSCTFPGQIDVV